MRRRKALVTDKLPKFLLILPQNGHQYEISRRLTKKSTNCILGQVSQAANENRVPGVPGSYVSGSIYEVSTAGISPRHIQFLASSDGRTFSNTTMSDHMLRYGSVTRPIPDVRQIPSVRRKRARRGQFAAAIKAASSCACAFRRLRMPSADPAIWPRISISAR